MSLPRGSKRIVAGVAALMLAGSVGGAFAAPSHYQRGGNNTSSDRRYYRHRHFGGIGVGPAIAGAALGIAGAAAAGVAADRYYNGYPAYGYGPGYGGHYGYDYIPDRGYYGPY